MNLKESNILCLKKIFYLKKKKWNAGGSSKGGGTFALIENGSVFEKVGEIGRAHV